MGDTGVFVPYGPTHWSALTVGVLGAVVLVVVGRRLRGSPAERTFCRAFAVAILVLLVPLQLRLLTPGTFDVQISLPLQLSDLSWITAAYALWTRRAWACAPLYYWGLTLTPQALLTPATDAPDFPHVAFLHFWALHLLVTWAAVYLTWGAGVRPTWRGMRVTLAITVGWAAVVLPFNLLAGTNYGFLARPPSNASLLDLLGPWPWYLVVELALVAVGWSAITWPWTRRQPAPAQP